MTSKLVQDVRRQYSERTERTISSHEAQVSRKRMQATRPRQIPSQVANADDSDGEDQDDVRTTHTAGLGRARSVTEAVRYVFSRP